MCMMHWAIWGQKSNTNVLPVDNLAAGQYVVVVVNNGAVLYLDKAIKR